jgi:hypothetical protein
VFTEGTSEPFEEKEQQIAAAAAALFALLL